MVLLSRLWVLMPRQEVDISFRMSGQLDVMNWLGVIFVNQMMLMVTMVKCNELVNICRLNRTGIK